MSPPRTFALSKRSFKLIATGAFVATTTLLSMQVLAKTIEEKIREVMPPEAKCGGTAMAPEGLNCAIHDQGYTFDISAYISSGTIEIHIYWERDEILLIYLTTAKQFLKNLSVKVEDIELCLATRSNVVKLPYLKGQLACSGDTVTKIPGKAPRNLNILLRGDI